MYDWERNAAVYADIPFDSGLGHNLLDRNRVFIYLLFTISLFVGSEIRG
jgi:hypothetical protein